MTAQSPDNPSAANGDPALGIGVRLAELRVRRGLQVSALARKVDVSASLISQIERGRSRPSVSTLFALAEALEVPVDTFFRSGPDDEPQPARARARDVGAGEAPPHRYLVRRERRSAIDIEGGVRWERLMPTSRSDVEFMELVYEPGAESHAALYRHPGTEMVLVLSGTLVIFVGFERYELEPGDSICFPSSMPHRYVNPTDEVTRSVTVILPDDGQPGTSTNKRS